jgi:4,5-DOPA dioxygenase extradiol
MKKPQSKELSEQKMPVLFIGHGSPENVIFDNSYTRDLQRIGKELPKPKAILVISAHWLTVGTSVSCVTKPQTIYDFYGFPEEMYTITYPAPGSPEMATKTKELISNVNVSINTQWGLDHGAWTVLYHLFPKADIPTYQLSIDYQFHNWKPRNLEYYYEIGKQLANLRSQGVLIIGSGNITHNLGIIDFENIEGKPMDWAKEFDEYIRNALVKRDLSAIFNYEKAGQPAHLAVPTLDHYLPMIYTLGLQEENDKFTFIHEGFQYGSLTMRAFKIG